MCRVSLSALRPEAGGEGCRLPDPEVYEHSSSATFLSSCPAPALVLQFSLTVKPASLKHDGLKQQCIISQDSVA